MKTRSPESAVKIKTNRNTNIAVGAAGAMLVGVAGLGVYDSLGHNDKLEVAGRGPDAIEKMIKDRQPLEVLNGVLVQRSADGREIEKFVRYPVVQAEFQKDLNPVEAIDAFRYYSVETDENGNPEVTEVKVDKSTEVVPMVYQEDIFTLNGVISPSEVGGGFTLRPAAPKADPDLLRIVGPDGFIDDIARMRTADEIPV